MSSLQCKINKQNLFSFRFLKCLNWLSFAKFCTREILETVNEQEKNFFDDILLLDVEFKICRFVNCHFRYSPETFKQIDDNVKCF